MQASGRHARPIESEVRHNSFKIDRVMPRPRHKLIVPAQHNLLASRAGLAH
jgi:hypothetical protein